MVIVGGNTTGRTATLASTLISGFTYQGNDPYETAIGIVLAVLVLVLLGSLSLLAQRGGVRLRFRAAG